MNKLTVYVLLFFTLLCSSQDAFSAFPYRLKTTENKLSQPHVKSYRFIKHSPNDTALIIGGIVLVVLALILFALGISLINAGIGGFLAFLGLSCLSVISGSIGLYMLLKKQNH